MKPSDTRIASSYRSFPIRTPRAIEHREAFVHATDAFVRNDRWLATGYVEMIRHFASGRLERYRLYDDGRLEFAEQAHGSWIPVMNRKIDMPVWHHDMRITFESKSVGPHWHVTLLESPIMVHQGRLRGRREVTYVVGKGGVARYQHAHHGPAERVGAGHHGDPLHYARQVA